MWITPSVRNLHAFEEALVFFGDNPVVGFLSDFDVEQVLDTADGSHVAFASFAPEEHNEIAIIVTPYLVEPLGFVVTFTTAEDEPVHVTSSVDEQLTLLGVFVEGKRDVVYHDVLFGEYAPVTGCTLSEQVDVDAEVVSTQTHPCDGNLP